jgi:hypothetical protein
MHSNVSQVWTHNYLHYMLQMLLMLVILSIPALSPSTKLTISNATIHATAHSQPLQTLHNQHGPLHHGLSSLRDPFRRWYSDFDFGPHLDDSHNSAALI